MNVPQAWADAIAEVLLAVGAVAIRVTPPFRYRSGLLSPIYTDNRLLCSYPRQRRLITAAFAALIADHDMQPDVLAGVSTAGIPHAAWLAEQLELPMVYVRAEAKDHGKGKRVEGTLTPQSEAADSPGAPQRRPNQPPRVVVVEDLVTTGGGALEAVAGVREEGGLVEHCLAICTYGFAGASAAFAAANVKLFALCSYDNLAAAAGRLGVISSSDLERVLDWQADPAGWATRNGVSAGD